MVLAKIKRKAAVATAVAVSGMTLAAISPAPASAAAASVPSCVTTIVMPEVFGSMGVAITNNCESVQRVKPTFQSVIDSSQIRCDTLQPGQEVTQWVRPAAPFNKFLGLVSC
ncbi:hypothetical protein [Streptomyces sp. SH5]|uniref:hypothetical protein n=1 Tax=Streptomyces sp. SH5 TaxID=3041765 RepID=UPI002477E8DF|nr:hypothetical protein [Streptomyces sp. SH5]WGP12958.1 hypothetical protein QFA72_26435 [Streptomyces sp. SH5]